MLNLLIKKFIEIIFGKKKDHLKKRITQLTFQVHFIIASKTSLTFVEVIFSLTFFMYL